MNRIRFFLFSYHSLSLFASLALLMVLGCATPKKLMVELPSISEVRLPDTAKRWLLIDRSPIRSKKGPPPRLMRDDAIPYRFEQASILTIERFIKYVENEVPQATVIPVHLQLARSAGSPPPTLDTESIIYLCEEYKSQGLIALESLDIQFDTLVYEDPEVIGGGYWEARLSVSCRAMWRIYSADGRNVWDRWTEKFRHQMYGKGVSRREALNDLPSKLDIYHDWIAERGEAYASSIYPPNVRMERGIFLGKTGPIRKIALDMEKAGNLALAKRWEEAARIWAPIARTESLGKTAHKAAYNMALACEAMGDLRSARQWLLLAAEEYHFTPAKYYLQRLRQRLSTSTDGKS
ncbi:MAG: DUF6340 family protein [Bacteroidota bacterium]